MTGEDARAQAAPRRLPTEQAKRMKIISFGSEAVGKSCLVKRFCEEKFVSKYISTIGVDFGVKPVKVAGQSIRINLFSWPGGQPHPPPLSRLWTKNNVGTRRAHDARDAGA